MPNRGLASLAARRAGRLDAASGHAPDRPKCNRARPRSKSPALRIRKTAPQYLKAIAKKPVAVYVEKFYDEGDFSQLGIGT